MIEGLRTPRSGYRLVYCHRESTGAEAVVLLPTCLPRTRNCKLERVTYTYLAVPSAEAMLRNPLFATTVSNNV